MRSSLRGKHTSDVSIQGVTPHGVWLWCGGAEYLLSFEEHPWFRDATIAEIQNVKLLHGKHLHWKDLDVDLAVESLAHPERFPLQSRKWRKPRTRRAVTRTGRR